MSKSSKEFVYVNRKSDHSFTCAIERIQCQHQKKGGKGEQCTLQSVLGYGACHHHLASVFHLKIKQNRLYAWCPKKKGKEVVFDKGDIIVEYGGEIITKNEKERRYEKQRGPYVAVTSDQIYDGACIRGIGSLAHRDQKGNAKLKRVNGKTVLVALKDIRHDTEIILLDEEAEKIRKPYIKAYDRITRKRARNTSELKKMIRGEKRRGKNNAILKKIRGGKDTAMLKRILDTGGIGSGKNDVALEDMISKGNMVSKAKSQELFTLIEAATQGKRGKARPAKGSKAGKGSKASKGSKGRKGSKASKGSKAKPKRNMVSKAKSQELFTLIKAATQGKSGKARQAKESKGSKGSKANKGSKVSKAKSQELFTLIEAATQGKSGKARQGKGSKASKASKGSKGSKARAKGSMSALLEAAAVS